MAYLRRRSYEIGAHEHATKTVWKLGKLEKALARTSDPDLAEAAQRIRDIYDLGDLDAADPEVHARIKAHTLRNLHETASEMASIPSTTIRRAPNAPDDSLAADNETDNEEDPGEEPLSLAGTEPIEQPAWEEDPRFRRGSISYMRKHVPLDEAADDWLHFEAMGNREENEPEIESVMQEHDLDTPHEVLMGRGPKDAEPFNSRMDITGQGKQSEVMRHMSQALRELIHEYKPVSTEFSASEPIAYQGVLPHDAKACQRRRRQRQVCFPV